MASCVQHHPGVRPDTNIGLRHQLNFAAISMTHHTSQAASSEVCEYVGTPLSKVQTWFKHVILHQQSGISTNLSPL